MDVKNYVISNYCLNHKIDLDQNDLGYGQENGAKINIVNQANDFFEHLDKNRIPNYTWIEWSGEKIPVLFSSSTNAEVITKNKNGSVQINYDIIGSIFYFLSGWQEIVCDKKDHYGRFPFKESIQSQIKITEIPVVDYYYDILTEAICHAYNQKEVKRKVSQKGFSTFISHDIDQCKTGWKEAGFSELKKKHFLSMFKIAAKRISGKDVWFNFNDILNYNQKRGIHACFFFLTRKGKNTKYNIMNADYNIQSNTFKKVFNDIENNDCEVGLQGSLDTGIFLKEMKADKEAIPSKIHGNRCHFLLYDLAKLPAILDECDISYDNTSGFAEHIGFRHSTCSPFHFYDFQNNRVSKSIALPLVIMDRTLSQKQYMNVKQNDVLETCKKVILETKKFNGLLSILWHNHHFSPYKFSGWKETLDQLLDFVEQNEGSYLSGHEVSQILKQD